MKKLLILLLLPLTGQAAYIWNSGALNGGLGVPIPDNNPAGQLFYMTVTGDTPTITGVQVVLDLSSTGTGGWGGDIYCYLTNDTGFSVLLNRIGRTATNDIGANNNSFGNGSQLFTLSDSATTNVHSALTAAGNPLVGTYKPDGRNIDPAFSLDTTSSTANLGVFNGQNSNVKWTLFVADVASGGTMTLNSWQMTIVPEPSAAALGALGLASLVLRRRRR